MNNNFVWEQGDGREAEGLSSVLPTQQHDEEVGGGLPGHVLGGAARGGAHVGGDHALGVLEERVVSGQGLGVRDVQPSGHGPAGLQRLVQRLVVHDHPARRVDQDGALLHLGERVLLEGWHTHTGR